MEETLVVGGRYGDIDEGVFGCGRVFEPILNPHPVHRCMSNGCLGGGCLLRLREKRSTTFVDNGKFPIPINPIRFRCSNILFLLSTQITYAMPKKMIEIQSFFTQHINR